MPRKGYGKKDGSGRGFLEGGLGRNRVDDCRHPLLKKRRK